MKVFDLDRRVVDTYEAFSRSFSLIAAGDLREAIAAEYAAQAFWPSPLLTFNPLFEQGRSAAEMAAAGVLSNHTAQVFRLGGCDLRFHRHQEQAIVRAGTGQSFVVTTGTGSGKSLCFFVPIIDAAIRARLAGEPRRTRAVIVYPMNALANSQLEEAGKFLRESGLPDHLRPTVARYTGQESEAEKQRIADDPPDILLTNFMMLELLLVRQDVRDARVINNAEGLRFIVLDELHTYRGRQGADVAVLVRRLRDRCCLGAEPICIGTSATMVSEGTEASRREAVAGVARRLFGVAIGPDGVIDESLRRATDDTLSFDAVRPALALHVTSPLPDLLPDDAARTHPLAVWIEMALGLDDGMGLRRQPPRTVAQAATMLSEGNRPGCLLCWGVATVR